MYVLLIYHNSLLGTIVYLIIVASLGFSLLSGDLLGVPLSPIPILTRTTGRWIALIHCYCVGIGLCMMFSEQEMVRYSAEKPVGWEIRFSHGW